MKNTQSAVNSNEMLDGALTAYRRAAEKFIAKVDSGRAYSRETYADMKEAIRLHDELRANDHKA